MTDFKKIIGVSTEEDYKINPDLTKKSHGLCSRLRDILLTWII